MRQQPPGLPEPVTSEHCSEGRCWHCWQCEVLGIGKKSFLQSFSTTAASLKQQCCQECENSEYQQFCLPGQWTHWKPHSQWTPQEIIVHDWNPGRNMLNSHFRRESLRVPGNWGNGSALDGWKDGWVLPVLFWFKVSLYCSGWPGAYQVVQTSLDLCPTPSPPKCWELSCKTRWHRFIPGNFPLWDTENWTVISKDFMDNVCF